jgi:hypothetical protein
MRQRWHPKIIVQFPDLISLEGSETWFTFAAVVRFWVNIACELILVVR